DRQVELLETRRWCARGLDRRPITRVEVDRDALFGEHLAVGGMRCARLDDQPEAAGRSVLQPEHRGGVPRDGLIQLRHDPRAGRWVERQVQGTTRGILDLLDREPLRTQDIGNADPAGRANRYDLESIAGLELGSREDRSRGSWHTRGLSWLSRKR